MRDPEESSSAAATHADRELLRRRIVRACYLARGNGLNVELLREYCRMPAGRPGAGEMADHVDYLVGAGLLEPVAKAISPAVKAWKISKAGRDYAEEEGLDA